MSTTPYTGVSPVISALSPKRAVKIPFTRKISSTEVLTINPSDITFELSSAPLHPYENLKLTTSPESETGRALYRAAEKLRTSDIPVAFPTETVYGLGADATRDDSVKNIFAVKDRFTDNPLIVHIASLQQARELLKPSLAAVPSDESSDVLVDGEESYDIPEAYKPLIDRFWPGPLTILLPLPTNSILSPYVYSTQTTVGVRMPSHPVALSLALLSGLPIAAPSANKSGLPSPTTCAHVLEDLRKRVELILDGGPCRVGVESTVVDGLSSPPAVLRPGGISLEQLRECGGVWKDVIVHNESDDEKASLERKDEDENAGPRAPGMKYKHYSPACSVRLYLPGAIPPTPSDLIASAYGRPGAKVGLLRTRTWQEGIGSLAGEDNDDIVIVEDSLGVDGEEISRKLFGALRRMDDEGVTTVHIEGIEESGEGLAVMNRLRKAASVVARKPRV